MKPAIRFAATLFAVALLASFVSTASAQTISEGTYRGTGPMSGGGEFQFDVVVEKINPDGTIVGTNQHYAGYLTCRPKTALSGLAKDGAVELEAPGPNKDCFRKWDLKFTGTDELAGSLNGPSGTFQVKLKKQKK